MKKYYHMIIARNDAAKTGCAYGSTRREYISTKQGSAPAGWFCVGVCGYHEEPDHKKNYADEKEA